MDNNIKLKFPLQNKIFYILNIASFIYMIYPVVGPGIISSLLMFLVVLFNFKYFSFLAKGTNILFLIYFVISLFSGFSYILLRENSPSLFFYGISYNLMPMVMYTVGALQAKTKSDKVLVSIIISNFTIISLGMILYFWEPTFYRKIIALNILTIVDPRNGFYRFPSYVGSLIVGNIASVSIPLVFLFRDKMKPVYNNTLLITFILGSILSMQRSSFIATAFALSVGWIIILSKNKSSKNIKIIVGVLLLFLLLFFIYNNLLSDLQKSMFSMRSSNLSSAVNERISQWIDGIKIFLSYPLGTGLGSAGHKAVSVGSTNVVPDGNYFRILAELGLFGLIAFLGLNITIFMKAIRRNKYLSLVIFIFLFQAVGTNVFDLYYTSHIYWFVMGFVANINTKS